MVALASPSDEVPRGPTALRRKLTAYQANGARLGRLLIPEQRAVEIWGSRQPLDALPQFAAEAEGGSGAEQRQGAGGRGSGVDRGLGPEGSGS